MPPHSRKLKVIQFTLDSTNYECQITNWQYDPGIPDGEVVYTYCPDGAVVEDGEPTPSLQLTFLSDWTENGISDFLTVHSGEDVAFALVHHPDTPLETVHWTGTLRVKAPPVGGEARSGERTEVTLQCVGEPTYGRGAA